MSSKYIAPGQIIEVTAPEAVSADEVVQVGQIVGMAIHSADNGDPVQLGVVGIYTFPCKSTDDIAQGDLLYWDTANDELTSTASGNLLVGYAVAASGSGTATVDVKLTGQARPDEAP